MNDTAHVAPAGGEQPAQSEIRTVGVAGGGQLAQMMLPAAAALGLRMVVLDPDPACSAAAGAATALVGALDSYPSLLELAELSDVVTFEIEKVSAQALHRLEDLGHVVRPSSAVLETIQDKLVQKQFLHAQGLLTSPFAALDEGAAFDWPLPCVWKARRDGYDGRGVMMLRERAVLETLPTVPALLEALIDIDYELAILVARDCHGAVVHYPVVEIVMDPHAHVMDTVIAPAQISSAIDKRCREMASVVVEALDYVGVMALEFFVDRAGQVYVNELSPRPHNSGHYTIEACPTSQFEQHLRAVSGRGLGAVDLQSAALTFNVLGDPGAQGVPRYHGFEPWPAADQIYVHCYDKPEVRPGRKMGHVTVLAETRAAAIAKAARIKDLIRVDSSNE